MNMHIRRAGLMVLLAPFLLFGDSPKLSPDLASDPSSVVDVIVQFDGPPGESQHAGVRQLGGTLKADLGFMRAGLYSLPARALEALANNPNVIYVSPDRQVNATLDYANPAVGAQMLANYGW